MSPADEVRAALRAEGADARIEGKGSTTGRAAGVLSGIGRPTHPSAIQGVKALLRLQAPDFAAREALR